MEQEITEFTDSARNRTFFRQAGETLSLPERKVNEYSGLALAFIGDGVYELAIRSLVLSRGNCAVNKLHHKCAELVKAPSQAAMVNAIYDRLTEDEQSAVRRGRNTSPHTKAKNATTEEYLLATGFEALCGYLYLSDEQERLMEVIRMGLEAISAI